MSHLEGWQRRGEAGELGESQSCHNPLTRSLPEPKRPREACRQRSAGVPRCRAEHQAASWPLHPGVLHLQLGFSSLRAHPFAKALE